MKQILFLLILITILNNKIYASDSDTNKIVKGVFKIEQIKKNKTVNEICLSKDNNFYRVISEKAKTKKKYNIKIGESHYFVLEIFVDGYEPTFIHPKYFMLVDGTLIDILNKECGCNLYFTKYLLSLKYLPINKGDTIK